MDTLIEGNPSATGRESFDFAYWAVFIYDAQTQNADRITPITKCGATAFANPHWTILTLPNGQRGLLTVRDNNKKTMDRFNDQFTKYNAIAKLESTTSLEKSMDSIKRLLGDWTSLEMTEFKFIIDDPKVSQLKKSFSQCVFLDTIKARSSNQLQGCEMNLAGNSLSHFDPRDGKVKRRTLPDPVDSEALLVTTSTHAYVFNSNSSFDRYSIGGIGDRFSWRLNNYTGEKFKCGCFDGDRYIYLVDKANSIYRFCVNFYGIELIQNLTQRDIGYVGFYKDSLVMFCLSPYRCRMYSTLALVIESDHIL
eukprot:gene2249-2546_t